VDCWGKLLDVFLKAQMRVRRYLVCSPSWILSDLVLLISELEHVAIVSGAMITFGTLRHQDSSLIFEPRYQSDISYSLIDEIAVSCPVGIAMHGRHIANTDGRSCSIT